MSRILYYERYGGFGVLYYPHEPFDLAVIWSGKNVFVRPIINLPSGESYFLYQGKKINPFDFDLRPDEPTPAWADAWVQGLLNGQPLNIDVSNLTGEHIEAFKAMLERKNKELQKWLSSK